MKQTVQHLLCVMLVVALLIFAAGCRKEPPKAPDGNLVYTELGTGAKHFSFIVTDPSGAQTGFKIATDANTVGDALIALELIAGDEGPYGLYVKTVNGLKLDYDTDGKYWAFYADGEMCMTGVDMTEIVEGTVYEFRGE